MSDLVIGIVSDDEPAPQEFQSAVIAAFEADGISIRRGPPERLVDLSPDIGIAIGRGAVSGLANENTGFPILPLGYGTNGLDAEQIEPKSLVSTVKTRAFETETGPILTVRKNDDSVGRAVLDCSLMSAEPARIAEYSVIESGRQIGSMRADGIVVATPLGSTDYAHQASGPILRPSAVGVVVVVPVAPFHTQRTTWVLDPTDLEIRIIRTHGPVDIRVDGRLESVGSKADTITCSIADSVDILRPHWVSDSDK